MERVRQQDISLWKTLDEIQGSLGLGSARMAELLDLTEAEFLKHQKVKRDLKLTNTMALASALNVSFDSIVQKDFDIKALVRQYFGENEALPEKYTRAAFSKRRNGLAILGFIEGRFGWQKRALILRRFQMNEAMFIDPDAPISGEFGHDVLSFLLHQYRDGELISQIGEASIHSHRNTVVGSLISRARSPSEAYEITMNEVAARYFNRNDRWSIRKLTADFCELASIPNYSLLLDQKANINHFVNPLTCRLNLGYLRTFPVYAGFPAVRVIKTSCVCQGDPECRFVMSFERAERREIPHSGRRLTLVQ